ncbi:cell division protein ZapA [Rhizosphaericola mali]|uniref:Cell division protein ZapA n=1 Tax=Rhizosphaericola mali TaxID=2545455 RepID=A0A5P2G3A2_9BACT|nr:cell division protein ZapA [Rhizosphaericola mali]QES90286.1 cell division protein ZapA [Rhizosphaericola mali]
MDQKIPVNIVVGDRTYRVKIDRVDEELVRKTMSFVNEKIIEFKTHFAGKDMQDYIAMALLWFATEQNQTGTFKIKEQETNQKLSSWENMLNKLLDDKESED